jgi:competence ComEA-like helix-hairpin-helix protein
MGAHRETPAGVASGEMTDRFHDLEMQAMLHRAGIWAQSDPESLGRLRAQERAEDQELKDFRDQLRKPPSATRPIDLNTATSQQLQSISGIGPVLAAKIIAGRPYKSVADLRKVDGVGAKTYERISSYFKVSLPAK